MGVREIIVLSGLLRKAGLTWSRTAAPVPGLAFRNGIPGMDFTMLTSGFIFTMEEVMG